jgi:AAA15 family ATPase/GTPase
MSKEDLNKKALEDGENEILIGVTFSDLPESIVIDASNETTLVDEYLLNSEGKLEIVKKYINGGSEKVFIKASHPNNTNTKDLLQKKQRDLQAIVNNNSIECTNRTINAELRKSIWNHFNFDLGLEEILIDANKISEKDLWEKIKNYMPLYALFQSDRKNSDGDSEVQDPMKLAVKEILSDANIVHKFNEIAETVERKLTEVADTTLDKLREMNPDIANQLTPVIPSSDTLKWVDVFKNVSISSDDDISFNKRGSGVKRLILLNFFRAEAERRKSERNVPDVIYAIEEPETSQHPDHQKKLIQAFIELANSDNSQIILTTHSPSVVKELDFNNLRLLVKEETVNIRNIEPQALSFPSLNEINFIAFEVVPEEYHSELFEKIKELYDTRENTNTGIKQFDNRFFNVEKGEALDSPWRGNANSVTIHTFIRNQIHHRGENGIASEIDLKTSIEKMRHFILEWAN